MKRTEEHDRFLELAARSEICTLSETDFLELQAHLKACAACRIEAARLTNLFSNASLAGGTDQEAGFPLPEFFDANDQRAGEIQLRERLRTTDASKPSRPIKEVLPVSISLQLPVEQPQLENLPPRRRSAHRSLPLLFGAIAAALLLTVGTLGYRLWRERSITRSQAAEIARLDDQRRELQLQISTLRDQRTDSIANLESKVSAGRAETSRLAKHSAELEEELKVATAQVQGLRDQLSAGKVSESQMAARLRDEQSKVAQITRDLEVARKTTEDTVAQSNEDAAVRADLERRLAAQTEAIERERRLLAANRDIRDLMGARNLHIIDVFDVNGEGKTQKSFGRVFYTQGKSLTFVAFDLGNDKKHKGPTDAAFQVWGAQGWDQRTARNLGIFYQDDKTNNRWVLTFSDPNVLAEIDSVFVTLEPPGGSKKPTGREILSAYLNSKINHP
jgi:hypothetical protein